MPLISPVNEKVFCAFHKAMTYFDIKLDKNLSISNLEHILPYMFLSQLQTPIKMEHE